MESTLYARYGLGFYKLISVHTQELVCDCVYVYMHVYTQVCICANVCTCTYACICMISGSFKADTDLNPTCKELGLTQEVRHAYKQL